MELSTPRGVLFLYFDRRIVVNILTTLCNNFTLIECRLLLIVKMVKMIELDLFKEWLSENTTYSDAVIKDMASRMKRANSIVTWEPTTIYLFKLEQNNSFKKMSVSVKSQIRRAVKCYSQFILDKNMKR